MGEVATSFDYGLNAAATEYDGKHKYLRITDIDDETHEFLERDLTTPLVDLEASAGYLLKEGDLLFARTGASVGKPICTGNMMERSTLPDSLSVHELTRTLTLNSFIKPH